MPHAPNVAPASPDAVQTAIVRACEVCGAEVQGRRMATCSDRCRSERWRRRQEQRQQDRDARVAALLREATRLLEEGQE
jgi:predicted nucleic acid-binding Zn ribbon protein